MRWLVVIFSLFWFSSFAEMDSLSIHDKTVLEIVNGKEIFQAESDWWDKYSSGLIAAFTVIISLGISVWQARKTTKATRANSISEARIEWVNNLRPLLGELIVLTTSIRELISEMGKYYDKDQGKIKAKLTAVEQKWVDSILKRWQKQKPEFDSVFNQIKLFLNPVEKEHKEFIEMVNSFIENARDEIHEPKIKNGQNEEDLIEKAQKVLKNAWEQAKNEDSNSIK